MASYADRLKASLSCPVQANTRKPRLLLLRGIHGPEKTTLINHYKKHFNMVPVSIDDYFTRDGVYTFDLSKLTLANRWCIDRVKFLLQQGNDVIVHNKFMKLPELEPYINIRTPKEVTVYLAVPLSECSNNKNTPENMTIKDWSVYRSYPGEVDVKLNTQTGEIIKSHQYPHW